MIRLFLFLKAAVSAICTPPQPGDESYETFIKVRPSVISLALIGSFLSSLRVQTDKIDASFQVQLSAVKLSTF